MPRVIGAGEWAKIERGLVQRMRALNLFLDDIYGEQKILREGIIPADLVLGAKAYETSLRGIKAPGGVRIPIAGIDLIRESARARSAYSRTTCARLRASPTWSRIAWSPSASSVTRSS